jgi:hypothetical protein
VTGSISVVTGAPNNSSYSTIAASVMPIPLLLLPWACGVQVAQNLYRPLVSGHETYFLSPCLGFADLSQVPVVNYYRCGKIIDLAGEISRK